MPVLFVPRIKHLITDHRGSSCNCLYPSAHGHTYRSTLSLDGNTVVLTVVDRLSKMANSIPLPKLPSAKETAGRSFAVCWGLPSASHLASTPQSNGQLERLNQELEKGLRITASQLPNWFGLSEHITHYPLCFICFFCHSMLSTVTHILFSPPQTQTALFHPHWPWFAAVRGPGSELAITSCGSPLEMSREISL